MSVGQDNEQPKERPLGQDPRFGDRRGQSEEWLDLENAALRFAAIETGLRAGMPLDDDCESIARLGLGEAARVWLEAIGWTPPGERSEG